MDEEINTREVASEVVDTRAKNNLMSAFQVQKLVRFQHTDPAGLVFYPRYFEMINQVVEDWFRDGLGTDFRTMHEDHGRGVPTVHIEMDFPSPARLGDVLDFTLSVSRLGRSAVELEIRAFNGKQECLRGHSTLVYVDTSGPSAQAWPPALRQRMAAYMSEPKNL